MKPFAMNSSFELVNVDDYSSYDVGTPSFLANPVSPPQGRESRYKHHTSEVFVFIEPTISTYPIDPESKERLNDDVDRLLVETHYVSITTEIVTPQLLAKDAIRNRRNKENVPYIEISIDHPKANEPQEPKSNKVVKPISEHSPPKRKVVRVCSRSSFVPVRLKSGEVVKTSKDILVRLRSQRKDNLDSNGEITVFKLPSSLQAKRVVHVPFSDRMSAALKRLSDNRTTVTTASPRKNGKIANVLKLRSALDKSSVALQASTVRLKPKTGLLDHLNIFAESVEKPMMILSDNNKNLPPQKPSSLVPLVMKLKSHSQSTRLLPLSTALRNIANGYNDHSTCNGSHSKE